MKRSVIQTKNLPESGYERDASAQAALDGRAGWKMKQYLACAAGVAVAIGAVILGGYLASPLLVWLGWSGFLLCTTYAMVLGVMHPQRVCSACGAPFEKRWEKGEGEMEDLFLVCECCKKYVFAHEVRS